MSLPERELKRVIAALRNAPDVVLIGGQALYFWYQTLAPKDAALRHLPPPTSKDVDFQGTAAAAQRCAEGIPGEYKPAGFDDSIISSALVTFTDADGNKHTVDFIHAPRGLTTKEVYEGSSKIKFNIDGEDLELRVMNPLHCMVSRTANVIGLGRTNEHSMTQLHWSIACVRVAFNRSALGAPASATEIAEGVYDLARSARGLRLFKRHGVDVMSPLSQAPEFLTLPEAFREKRYPQMCAYIRKKRRV